MFRAWWQKFFSFPRSRFARRRGYRPPIQLVRRTFRLSMTALEDRVTPAFNMLLSLNPTVGVTTTTVATTTTFSASATGANLSWNDIAAQLNAGNNVIVDSGSTGAEAGNITDVLVGGIGINNAPGTGLTFRSGTGALVGDITINPIDLVGNNSSITVSAQGNAAVQDLDEGGVQLASASITATTGSITGGTVKAVNLALSAGAGIGSIGTPFLTQASNLVAQTATGGIFVANTGNLNIGFVGAPFQGVTDSGAATDQIALSVNPGNTFTAGVGSGGVHSSGGNITLSADDMAIDDAVNAGAGIVTLQPTTTGRAIDLGLGTAPGELGLSNAELNLITAGTLRIGNTNSGAIVVTGAVAPTGTSTLTLTSGNGVYGNNNTDPLVVTNLAIRANFIVALVTTVTNLAVRNTAGGGVIVQNTASLNITAVDTLDGSAGNQQGNSGPVTLEAGGLITFAANFAATGTISVDNHVVGPGPVSGENIVVSPGVTIESTGGGVQLLSPNDIIVNATANVKADAGNIDFQTGYNNNAGNGVMTLNGTLAASGPVGLNVGAANTTEPPGTNGVTEGATGTITANGLLLYEFPAQTSTLPFVLNASTTNAVGTIAAHTAAPIGYRDSGALVVGNVNAPLPAANGSGIITNSNAVTLQAVGTITVSQEVNAGTAAATLNSTGGNIFQSGSLSGIGVAGGAINLNAGGTGGINLTVDTTTPATAGVTATTTNAPIILASTSQLQVDSINAGTGGDVTITVTNPNTATSSITSLHPNDNVPDVTGRTVSLTANGPSSGNTGQIGFFTTSAQFFEVQATTINAATNNSRMWISAIGGAAIGSVNAGNNTAFLRTVNGDLTSTHTGSTPDVIAAAVNLSQSPAATSGGFGTAANPLLLQTSSLTARIIAGNGAINVTNVAAGGNLAVVAAATVGGPINLTVAGGNLTTTAAAGTDINSPGGTVTLTASGTVDSTTAAGVIDVAATNLAITAGTGIGVTNPLKTTVTNLAFRNNATAANPPTAANPAVGTPVHIANTGALTIASVGGLATSANLGVAAGAITTLSAASPVAFFVDTTSAGTLTATAVDDNGPSIDNISVNPGVTVTSTGGDVVFLAGDDIDINGTVQSLARDVDLRAGFGDTDGEGVIDINGTVAAVATVTLNVNATNAALPAGTDIATETATGTITAAGLLLLNFPAGAPGAFSLDASTTNSVGTIAATTQAEIDYRNSTALTVGTVTSVPEGVTSFGILTTNHDVTLCTITGDISLTQGLNVGTATLRLASGGAVSQTAAGIITAANLGVTATSNIGLDQAANNVNGTIALNSTGGSVAFMDAAAFTIGTITASDCFAGATGIISGGDITLCSGGAMTITAPLTSTGTIRLQAGGAITQTAAGIITAVNLGVRANGAIDLCLSGSPNAVTGAFAADSSAGPAGSSVMFLDADGFTVGTITASGCFTAAAVGVSSNNADIDLVSTAGPINLTQAVNAGAGTVRINSGGAVTQTATGSITATNLAVVAVGAVGLCVPGSPNAVSGAIAGSGASFMFLDGFGFVVGTVAADACATGATGVTTTGGDIDLVSTAGPIALTEALNAGTGTIRLNSGGAITQTAAGTITAANLAAVAAGTVGLCVIGSPNAVSGTIAGSGTSFMFLDNPGFTVGTVAADACAAGATGVTTTAGDIDLVSITGPIALNAAVNAGANTVRINSGGAVSQSATGTITAANLAVVAGGAIDLCVPGSPNAVTGTIAASGTSFMFLDNPGFIVGTVAPDACALGATGVTATGGNIDLVSIAGPIALNAAVNAGAGTVRINSGGAITQTAAGIITAANLAAVAAGAVGLCVIGSPNAVSGTVAGSGTSFMFLDNPGFTVGTVAADACAAGATGVTTTAGDIDLVSSTGAISLAEPVNSGTHTVRINAAGDVSQTGTGTITAANLAVVAGGAINLCVTGSPNAVSGTLAASGASFMFLDGLGFTVGTVPGDACAAGATGVVTTGGDIDLVSTAGPIGLTQTVSAGTGTVRINSGGAVTQNATGIITAANLAVVATGAINLCIAGAPNAISGNVAASGASFMFLDGLGFTVGSVADDSCARGATGVTTTGGDVDLVSTTGPVVLTQPINAGAGTVRINSGGTDAIGSVYQATGAKAGAGTITAANLAVVASGIVNLCVAPNAISGTFAAQDNTAGASVMFKDALGFTVGTVAADACAAGATGVTTVNGDIDLVSGGSIALAAGVNAGTATVRLNAGGAIAQTAGGIVMAADLAAVAAGAVGLCVPGSPNAVSGTVAGSGASFMFLDGLGFTVGTVAGDSCAAGATGVTTTAGDIDLVSIAGPITLAEAVDAGSARVRLNSGGAVTQTAGGFITAQGLAVHANGNVDLTQANNLVGSLAAPGVFAALDTLAGAAVRFRDNAGAELDIGTIANDSCAAGATGVVTTNGDITIRNQQSNASAEPLNILRPISAGTGTVRLEAGGNIVQNPNPVTGSTLTPTAATTSTGPITASVLAVDSNLGSILLDRNNAVSVLAALAPTGNINFRDTIALRLDTVTADNTSANLFNAVIGVKTGTADFVRLATAGGLTQAGPLAGPIVTGTLGAINTTSGDINLLTAINYTALVPTGNSVGTFAASNSANAGQVDLATLGALNLGTVAADGSFGGVRGITTSNGNSNLQTGTNFTAIDPATANPNHGTLVPLITLGSGNFLLDPGQTGDSIVTFNAEASTTGTFRLGVPQATDAPPPPPPAQAVDKSPVPANPPGPAGNTLPANFHRDAFNVRPSSNVQILVNGNNPTTPPGDTLNLILTDLPANAAIQFTPGGVGAGRFDFLNPLRKAVPFTGIETLGGLSIAATAIQTGPASYSINAVGTLQGRTLSGGFTGGQVPPNPFVVSPNPVNPAQLFGAPRLAVGDFNGDGFQDLIIANGPANAPLITVFDGKKLFTPGIQFTATNLVSQFFAYNQNFQGGLFVAAGHLNAPLGVADPDYVGKVSDPVNIAEIVTGADIGGGPHVQVFAFNPQPGLDIYHNARDNAVQNPGESPFPRGGFFAYSANFTGGVRVALGDVDGDNKLDIVTGAGPGGGPHVEVFSAAAPLSLDSTGRAKPKSQFFAYSSNFTGGVYVAAGDYNGDGFADILTGAGLGGGPHVEVFSGKSLTVSNTLNILIQFMAFGPDGTSPQFGPDLGNHSGVGSVAFGDINGDHKLDILVGSARGPKTRLAAFLNGSTTPFNFATLTNFTPGQLGFTQVDSNGDLLDPQLTDGVNVAGLSVFA